MRLSVLAALVLVGAALGACASCGPPPMPKGAPPEYEEPPPPSWLNKDAGPEAGTT